MQLYLVITSSYQRNPGYPQTYTRIERAEVTFTLLALPIYDPYLEEQAIFRFDNKATSPLTEEDYKQLK